MYSPLGLVIFVAVEGTFVCFTKGQDHLFQIQFVAAAYEQTNACLCLRSCIQKCTGNIGRRHSARRHRIAPFDLRRASLPVAVAISYTVVRHAAHRVWYSFASVVHNSPYCLQLIGMRVVLYKLNYR